MKARRRLGAFASHSIACLLLIATSGVSSYGADPVQPRPHGVRVPVPLDKIRFDDGDTASIIWSRDEIETIRILGIDTPETRHVEHGIPFDQPFGREASAFGRGVLAMADEIELIRAATLDPYDRTLGYLFVNERNYSVLLLKARLAVETVSHYGDNGLPREAAACLDAAAKAGPVAFEPPHFFRKRMQEFSDGGPSEPSKAMGEK